MSFAERLQKFPDLGVTFRRPHEQPKLSLCLPRVLVVGEEAQGLVGVELAPIVSGGVGALRLLSALCELFEEIEEATPEQADAHGAELAEAAAHLRHHLNLTAAASDKAHAEHEASHQGQHGGSVH